MSDSQAKHVLFELGLPLLILMLLTLLFRVTDFDMQAAHYFFHDAEGWRFKDFWLWQLLYKRGMIPGILIGLGSLGGLLLGLRIPKLRLSRILSLIKHFSNNFSQVSSDNGFGSKCLNPYFRCFFL